MKYHRQWIVGVVFAFLLTLKTTVFAQALFVDDTSAVGGPHYTGETWGASWGDMNGDLYPDLFSSNHGALNSVLRNNGDGTFSDVVSEVDSERKWTGVPDGDFHGGSWADFDNDGDQDLFVTRSSVGARFQAMENLGLGGFTEESGPLGMGPYGGGRMPMFFDYNKDGHLDIMLAGNLSTGVTLFEWDNTLGKYVNKTSQAGLIDACHSTTHGLITDLFNNGKPHYFCIAESSILGVYDMSTMPFTDVSSSVASLGGTNTDVVLADFDNDLQMDVMANIGRIRPAGAEIIDSGRIEAWFSVSSSQIEDYMTFEADGAITLDVFARQVGEAGAIRLGAAGIVASELPITLDPTDPDVQGLMANRTEIGVYVGYDDQTEEWTVMLSTGGSTNSDGAYLTVDGSNFSNLNVFGLSGVDVPREPRFLINNGSSLVEQGAGGIGAVHCGGIAAADFDNDMDVDVYMACRNSTSNLENRLYLNDGTGNFSLSTGHGGEGIVGSGIESQTGTSGIALAADYNVDGFMDVFVTNGNRLFPLLSKDHFTGGGPGQFFRNLANNGNHWLELDLEGVTDTKQGFGARVTVTAGGITQLREHTGVYHRWSHDAQRLHFGLGANSVADVTIDWPDGTTDTHSAVTSNQLYRATQNGALSAISPALNAPSLSITSDGVYEADSANVTVELFPASANTVTVDYQTVDGTATDGADYTSVSGTLTFNPMQTSQPITIPGLTDILVEGTENFQVLLSNPSNATLNQPTGLIEIYDNDDAPPTGPQVSITNATVAEGEMAEFTITMSQASSETVVVNYETIEGTAEAGLDYTVRTGRVTFNPTDPLSVLRRITTLSDTLTESDETFSVRLIDPENANILNSTGIGTIKDEGIVVPDVSINNVSVVEGLSVDLTVSLSEITSETVTVDYTSIDGTALAGSDYTAISNTLIFAPNELSKTITLNTLQDSDQEGDESLTVVLSNVTNATFDTTIGIVDILDDDTPQVSIDSVTVEEGLLTQLTVSVAPAPMAPISVDYTTIDGTGTGGVDYTSLTDTLMFAIGETTKTIDVESLGDLENEADEDFDVILSNIVGGDISQGVGTVLITDNDDAPITGPEMSFVGGTIIEGGSVVFDVSLSQATSDIVTVDFITESGTAESDVDFQATSGQIIFQPNEISATQEIITIDDSLYESDEVFNLVFSNPQNANILNPIATGTIEDNDTVVPEVNIDSVSISEGLSVDLTVTLSEATTETVTVDYASVDGSALVGSDYLGVSDTLIFLPNEISKTITLDTIDDANLEPTEDLTVVLSNLNAATFGNSIGVVNILDDDPSQISIDSVNLAEGLTTLVTVSVTPAPIAQLSVDYASVDGSAESGIDYTPVIDTLIFEIGETSKTIEVDSLVDVEVETDETFTVELSNPVGGDISQGTGTVVIIDDDDAPNGPEISFSSGVFFEGGVVEFDVLLSQSSNDVVKVDFTTQGGTAESDVDFQTISGQVIFQPGETSALQEVTTIDDSLIESDEMFSLVFSNAENANILNPTVIGTIRDDDTVVPEISISDVSVDEGMSVEIVVSLSEATTETVTVDYTSIDGSALAGSDYIGMNDTLIFAPNEVSKTITLNTLQDTEQEGVEDLIVLLSNVTRATLVKPEGLVYIVDDEPPVIEISIAYGVANEGQEVLFDVTLSEASGELITVNFSTQDGSAESGLDYQENSGVVTFQPFEVSQTISVTTLSDDLDEPFETFNVILDSPTNAIIDTDSATGWIRRVGAGIIDPAIIPPILLLIIQDDEVCEGTGC